MRVNGERVSRLNEFTSLDEDCDALSYGDGGLVIALGVVNPDVTIDDGKYLKFSHFHHHDAASPY